MNEDNIPNESTSPEQPAPQVPGSTGSGHEIPTAFTSPIAPYAQPTMSSMPSSNPQGAAFGIPSAAYPYGTGHESTVPIAPIENHAAPQKKSFGAGKVAALIVAASLVGGAAGLGTSYLGNTLWAQPAGTAASGPESITVNNPGSVNETTAIATKVLPSVVTIEAAGQSESGSGSGVILSEDGYVLTNTHVVTLGGASGDAAIRVTTSDGHLYDASIVGTDPIYDLAVIKLEDAEDLSPIAFTDSSEINVGSTAVAVGAPLGLSNSVTTGIVSALNRSIQIASSALPESADQDAPEEESGQDSPFQFDLPGTTQRGATQNISISVIQTDAAINPGNSGGALVDSEGKLIGINVAIATAGGSGGEAGSIGVGFAIPSNIAQRVADEIIENGAATHGLLGATVQDASSVEDADVAGAYIVDVSPDGGAAAAGLKKGDIVTKFNGFPVSGATDLTAQVRGAAAGSEATVSYVRNGKSFEADVTLGELVL
ncbi:S1C family serine protease [Microbacterium sp. A588]